MSRLLYISEIGSGRDCSATPTLCVSGSKCVNGVCQCIQGIASSSGDKCGELFVCYMCVLVDWVAFGPKGKTVIVCPIDQVLSVMVNKHLV